jgi:hypothetical protein
VRSFGIFNSALPQSRALLRTPSVGLRDSQSPTERLSSGSDRPCYYQCHGRTPLAWHSMLHRIPILRALLQTSRQVVVRFPGARLLSAPLPIASYAQEHWEYAWLSVAAYNKTPAAAKKARKRLTNLGPSPEATLESAGWRLWKDFPDDGVLRKIKATHLRVEIWQRNEPDIIAVTFGGTVFNNGKDWRANLRWFSPGHRDEYTDVVQTFAPELAKRLHEKLSATGHPDPPRVVLVATGHSLGGGLAQQFAYSLPVDSLVKVARVYAFDPSPVTGFFSVQRKLRNHNKRGLSIDRIYERGEILALLRSLVSLFYKPTARNAAIKGVRYALFHAWNPIAAHSITGLAAKLDCEAKSPPSGVQPPIASVPVTGTTPGPADAANR